MRTVLSPTLIATHSGLRGRPGIDLTPEVVDGVAGGLAAFLQEASLPLAVAVARDDRPAGTALAAQAIDSLLRRGVDVVDLGAVSTPTAKIAARTAGLGAALVVTGSHLEPEWNGLKLSVAPHFLPLDVRELPAPGDDSSARGGLSRDPDAARIHVAAVLAVVDAERIRAARLGVTLAGGAGRAGAELLAALGCRSGTDVTFELDPDGDRLVLGGVDPEATLPLVALARRARIVVKGADTGSAVDALVDEVHVVPTGELYLARGVLETGAEVAGEGNGGAMIARLGLARDGLAAAAAVLELLARADQPLTELVGSIPLRPMCRSAVPVADPVAALESFAGGPVEDPHRGLRVERGGGWVLVRVSATEPALRITAEAATAVEAHALHDDILRAVSL